MSVRIGDIAVSGLSKVCLKMKVIEMTVIDASSLFIQSEKRTRVISMVCACTY